MKQVDLNTINCVKKQVAEGKRTLKKIAYDCSYFEKHADCDEAKQLMRDWLTARPALSSMPLSSHCKE